MCPPDAIEDSRPLRITLVRDLPAWVQRRGGFAPLVRAVGLIAWAAVVCVFLLETHHYNSAMTYRVGQGLDAMWATPEQGEAMAWALQELHNRAQPQASLVVLPQGVMLNYLSRRVNPTPYPNFTPLDLMVHGPDRVLHDLESHPPDWVAVIGQDLSDFGARGFRDYAESIANWVTTNYQPVAAAEAPDPSGQGMPLRITLCQRRAQ